MTKFISIILTGRAVCLVMGMYDFMTFDRHIFEDKTVCEHTLVETKNIPKSSSRYIEILVEYELIAGKKLIKIITINLPKYVIEMTNAAIYVSFINF